MRTSLILSVFLLIFIGCKTPKVAVNEPVREVMLDTFDVMPVMPKAPLQLAPQRTYDLIHTQLKVSFNFEKQYLFGEANLILKPYFYSQNKVFFDARNFEIKKVIASNKNQNILDTFKYNGKKLELQFTKQLTQKDTLNISISYIAKPNEVYQEGGAAIREDKGLYFIDPLDTDPNKPTQIWTQGEPQANSNWFPTFDYPNVKCTQEMEITVPNKYVTLSNGELEFSSLNEDDTRTDFWSQAKPHSPYLFMMAIGEFAVIEDFGYEVPVKYYVEPKYKEDAKVIFKHTPEMLTLFSEKLGVNYPWQKFDQVVVRDYVSGAMENTSAVIFGEFVQKTKRELIDGDNQDIVAHEMFHHWFGDLVTCEDWGNLTINESFATYGPYLWREYKHGKQDADRYLYGNKTAYLEEAEFSQKTLVRKRYNQPLEMFDRHSYSKGSTILHMLRAELGDEAFFGGLQNLLTKQAHKSIEATHLRLALEEVSGKNLQVFFDNWYYSKGHPEVEAFYFVNDSAKNITVELSQNKHPENIHEFFNLPLEVWVVSNNKIEKHSIAFFEEKKSFDFAYSGKLQNVIIDPKGNYLIDWKDNKPSSWLEHQYLNHPHFEQRLKAFKKLSLNAKTDTTSKEIMIAALDDASWFIQKQSLEKLDLVLPYKKEALKLKCVELSNNSNNSKIRQAALNFLIDNFSNNDLLPLLQAKLSDSSYAVLGEALVGVYKLNPQMGIVLAEEYEEAESVTLKLKLAELYARSGEAEKMDYFKTFFNQLNAGNKNTLARSWIRWCKNVDQNQLTLQTVPVLEQAILNESTWWNRLNLIEQMYDLLGFYMDENVTLETSTKPTVAAEISKSINRVLEAEKNPQVLKYF